MGVISIVNGVYKPTYNQWEFQDPKLEVPTIYKAYFLGLCKGISPQNMAKNMVILEFPLTYGYFMENPSMDDLGVPRF